MRGNLESKSKSLLVYGYGCGLQRPQTRCTILAAVLVLMLTSCGSAMFSHAKKIARLRDPRLKEISGIVASRANAGMLWAHNDGSNPASIYLLDTTLQVRCEVGISGATNRDWEEISIGRGPDPDKHYLYVADFGDNSGTRDVKVIYRIAEPVVRGSDALTLPTDKTIHFRYENGRYDAEAFFIDSGTGEIMILTKRRKANVVYRLKVPEGSIDTLTARPVAEINRKWIVAADGNDTLLLVKSYTSVQLMIKRSSDDVTEFFKGRSVRLRYRPEWQGESIAWRVDGKGYYTLGEKLYGLPVCLRYYQRKQNKSVVKRK